MTPKERETWNATGCKERCLHKIAQNNNPISEDEFVKRFGVQLDDTAYYGALEALGVPSKERTSDYSAVMRGFNEQGHPALILSEIDLNPGSTAKRKHCSVLTRIDDDGFSVWTPEDGGGEKQIDFTRGDWNAKKCSGDILGSSSRRD